LQIKGIKNIYAEGKGGWIVPDFDYVSTSDPDVIIFEHRMFSKIDVASIVNKRKWNRLKAVETGSVFVTPGNIDFLAHYGPSFITYALPWIEKITEKLIDKK
ncbi:MAG: ABC transporter substrate-binding protein, partial [Thermoplasmata archaeon]